MLTTSAKSILSRLIRSRFGDYRQDGNELKVNNCPFCIRKGRSADGYKLWINLDKDVYHCWRCGESGRASVLFPHAAGLLTTDVAPIPVEQKKELESLPSSLINLNALPQDHLVHEYLAARGFTINELVPYAKFCSNFTRIHREGYKYSFGPRLIFPIYQNDTYCGFQGRTIWRNTEPKYVSALGMEKKKLIWNYDTARNGNRIVLVEGIFDSVRVGPEGAAIFGKAISDEQIRLLQLGNFQQVIVWLDADATSEGIALGRQLANYFPTYQLVTKEFKDAGEVSRERIKELLEVNTQRVY